MWFMISLGCIATLLLLIFNYYSLALPRILYIPFLYPTLLVFLSSCQVWSPKSLMDQVSSSAPGGWSSTTQAQAGVDTQWINRFRDSQLERLVAEGLRHNGSIKAASERLKQAQQRARLTGAPSKPQLGIGVNGTRQSTRFLGIDFPGSGGASQYNSYGVSLNASWEIDLWGRIRAAQAAEVAAFEGQRWSVRGAEASLQAQIAKAYYALCEAKAQRKFAQQALEIREKTRDAIAERFERALISEGGTGAQYRISESDVASAKAEISRWDGQIDRAARQLELLIGRYPSGSVSSNSSLPKISGTPPVGLPSELLLRRPDILTSERRYAESIERQEEAHRALFPTIKLTGSAGTSTTSLKDILNSNFSVWSLGSGITQSILTGGQLAAEQVMRKSESKARLIELQDSILHAFGEVETTLSAETYLRQRLKETHEALELAQEAAEAAQHDYRDGTSTIQTLLDAESRQIQSASAAIALQRLLIENRIDLHLALGGDYKPSSK